MRILSPCAYASTATGLVRNVLSRDRIFPFYASFKLTCRCHFGCPYCNVKKDPTPDMPTDEVKAILDNLSRSSVLMVSFEGGEPLLRPDIGELLAYARTLRFYLLFTTSVRNLLSYPLDTYAPLIDFLHVSIDEGHGNMEMFDLLPDLTKLPTQVSVQTVVTRSTVEALEEKVRRCHEAGARIVVIPAAKMDNAEDHFPDMDAFEGQLGILRTKYPYTMHTPSGFFDAYRKHKCSTASIIIAPDGRLYYPCHILGTKGPDLRTTDLNKWLTTPEAKSLRSTMKSCPRNCGWYQYYSIDSYTSLGSFWESVKPMVLQGKRRG